MGTTHLALAAAMYFGLRLLRIPAQVDLVFAAVLIGSLFPDIDHPKSSIAKQSLILRGVSRAVSSVSEHRGVVHSLMASYFFAGLTYALVTYAGLDAAIAYGYWFGYVSHLLGDSMTRSGVGWLQPFSSRRIRGPFRTGSFREKVLSILLAFTALYLLLR
jgi:inner membrane protein